MRGTPGHQVGRRAGNHQLADQVDQAVEFGGFHLDKAAFAGAGRLGLGHVGRRLVGFVCRLVCGVGYRGGGLWCGGSAGVRVQAQRLPGLAHGGLLGLVGVGNQLRPVRGGFAYREDMDLAVFAHKLEHVQQHLLAGIAGEQQLETQVAAFRVKALGLRQAAQYRLHDQEFAQ